MSPIFMRCADRHGKQHDKEIDGHDIGGGRSGAAALELGQPVRGDGQRDDCGAAGDVNAVAATSRAEGDLGG